MYKYNQLIFKYQTKKNILPYQRRHVSQLRILEKHILLI